MPPPQAAPADAAWRREIVPDDVLLFRYSALTFNGHRIHYDRQYVTQVEGYPGLIVHGPLIATLLMDLLRRQLPEAEVASFRFKAVRPTFDLNAFHVNGQPAGRRQDDPPRWALGPRGLADDGRDRSAALTPTHTIQRDNSCSHSRASPSSRWSTRLPRPSPPASWPTSGARVIKIERPGSGDFARGYDERVRGLASHFVWTNRSKESLNARREAPRGSPACSSAWSWRRPTSWCRTWRRAPQRASAWATTSSPAPSRA